MRSTDEHPPIPAVLEGKLSRLGPAFTLLHAANEYAADLGRDGWDFAVDLSSLLDAGFTKGDLQWLICRGYVEHAVEITPPNAERRKFLSTRNLRLGGSTCFILTRPGMEIAEEISLLKSGFVPAGEESLLPAASAVVSTPRWDAELHQLWFGCDLVKEFMQPAPNQENVLTAFEQLRWPVRIADPLVHPPEQLPSERLRDTIKYLNRHQARRLIRFRGDGTGRGVRWEFLG